MRHTPLHFLLRAIMIALPPLAVLAAIYIYFDPMKALRPRDDYFADGLSPNKCLVSVRALEAAIAEGRTPDSFILGSSISCYYPAAHYRHILGDSARVLHFDTSGQSISTLDLSVRYICRKANPDNVLIVLNPTLFHLKEYDALPFIVHPELKDNPILYSVKYHIRFFTEFINRIYITPYLIHRATGRQMVFRRIGIFDRQPIRYDRITNEESLAVWDSIVTREPDYLAHRHGIVTLPADAPYTLAPSVINADVEKHLRSISKTLKLAGADLRLIMAPTIDRDVLCERDDSLMHEIFGDSYVNLGYALPQLIADPANYYDAAHIRPTVTVPLMDIAYGR